jgi:hypothetical protein
MGGERGSNARRRFKGRFSNFVTKLIDPFATLPALVAGYFC